jgi:hypothetical protein
MVDYSISSRSTSCSPGDGVTLTKPDTCPPRSLIGDSVEYDKDNVEGLSEAQAVTLPAMTMEGVHDSSSLRTSEIVDAGKSES